ncbi:MAG TPA: phospholipid carrier-dependent glycosyltransferase [Actinomycetota bacterium]|nr:phospholipid carrier-dependent glycosyltransferase [Actinomycetota bacterium]
MVVSEAPAVEERRVRDWSMVDTLCALGITVIAGVLRFARLGDPDTLVFDETYYAKDACWYLFISDQVCDTDVEITQVHPPLAKWLIAIGIRLFGYDSFGWRVSAAVAGTIGVLLVYLLARKLLRSTAGASIAAGLVALDFLHFVQSRISMLDIFAVTFGTAAVLFVVYDRDRLIAKLRARGPDAEVDAEAAADEEEDTEPNAPVVEDHGLLDRPWRIAAGAAGGAAAACKWNGGFYLLLVIVLTVTWEISARRREGKGWGGGARGFFSQELASTLLWLVLLPMLVYALSYVGRLEWTDSTWYRALWDRHKYMMDFHTGLASHHSYESPAWSWILLKRPVSFFFETDSQGRYKEIFAAGNPFVWWPAILALVYIAFRWLRSRDLTSPEGVIFGGFVATYLLWLPLSITGRSATFIFYLLPAIPFICLALGYIATRIGDTWEAKAAISLFWVGTVGLFIFYYPLLAQTALPKPDWDRRIWIFDDCDPAEPVRTRVTVTETEDGAPVTRATTTESNENLPPPGWCWI